MVDKKVVLLWDLQLAAMQNRAFIGSSA